MDPTPTQRELLAKLKREFGKSVIKEHAPMAPHGHVRVEAKCAAGVWQWYFDVAGQLVNAHLTARLFDMPAEVAKARNAIDN